MALKTGKSLRSIYVLLFLAELIMYITYLIWLAAHLGGDTKLMINLMVQHNVLKNKSVLFSSLPSIFYALVVLVLNI